MMFLSPLRFTLIDPTETERVQVVWGRMGYLRRIEVGASIFKCRRRKRTNIDAFPEGSDQRVATLELGSGAIESMGRTLTYRIYKTNQREPVEIVVSDSDEVHLVTVRFPSCRVKLFKPFPEGEAVFARDPSESSLLVGGLAFHALANGLSPKGGGGG
jgi:hypothetical protein